MAGLNQRSMEQCIVDHYLVYLGLLGQQGVPTDRIYDVAGQLLIAQKLHEIGDRFAVPDLNAEDLIPGGDWEPLPLEALGIRTEDEAGSNGSVLSNTILGPK